MLTCADGVGDGAFQKTDIMDFRKPGRKRSEYQFHFGCNKLEFTNKYKYLGLVLDEHVISAGI